jgi:hypothetical protein
LNMHFVMMMKEGMDTAQTGEVVIDVLLVLMAEDGRGVARIYGRGRERGSPDYGRGGNKRSPDFGREASPNGRTRGDGRGSPNYEQECREANPRRDRYEASPRRERREASPRRERREASPHRVHREASPGYDRPPRLVYAQCHHVFPHCRSLKLNTCFNCVAGRLQGTREIEFGCVGAMLVQEPPASDECVN